MPVVTSPRVRRTLAAVVLFVLLALPIQAAAATGVTFTLARKSAFAHTTTDMLSQRAASLFEGQTYAVTGRTADSLWVRLDIAGLHTEAWMLTSLGTISGDLARVPVVTPSAGAAPTAVVSAGTGVTTTTGLTTTVEATPLPAGSYFPTGLPVIPTVSQTARDIYQRD